MTASSQDREIHAGWKLGWIEFLPADRAIKGIALKVAIVISQRADRQGVALVSQEYIAKRIGSVERVVRRELQLLITLGYLESVKDGRLPGRGCAGRYRLVKRAALAERRTTESRTPEFGKADSSKFEKADFSSPPLPISSKDNPYARIRARARAGRIELAGALLVDDQGAADTIGAFWRRQGRSLAQQTESWRHRSGRSDLDRAIQVCGD